LHFPVYIPRIFAATGIFLRKLDDKHVIHDAEFLVDVAQWLQAGLHEL
jgi:transposase-like protein